MGCGRNFNLLLREAWAVWWSTTTTVYQTHIITRRAWQYRLAGMSTLGRSKSFCIDIACAPTHVLMYFLYCIFLNLVVTSLSEHVNAKLFTSLHASAKLPGDLPNGWVAVEYSQEWANIKAHINSMQSVYFIENVNKAIKIVTTDPTR